MSQHAPNPTPNDSDLFDRWRRLRLVTGITGLAAPVLILAPIIAISTAGEPDFTGDSAEVLAFLQASAWATGLSSFVFAVGGLAMVWFAVGLAFLLARAEGAPAWRSAVAAASAVMFAMVTLSGAGEAARHRAAELTPEIGLFAFDMSNLAFASSWVAIGSFLLCSGWVILGTRCMPRWLGWVGVVGGVGMALSRAWWTSPVWMVPYGLFWLFVVGVALWLVRHASDDPPQGAAADPAAGAVTG